MQVTSYTELKAFLYEFASRSCGAIARSALHTSLLGKANSPRGLGGSMVAPTYHDAGRNASFAISLLVYFPMQDALCGIACFLQNTGRCRTLQQCEDVTLSCRQDDL